MSKPYMPEILGDPITAMYGGTWQRIHNILKSIKLSLNDINWNDIHWLQNQGDLYKEIGTHYKLCSILTEAALKDFDDK